MSTMGDSGNPAIYGTLKTQPIVKQGYRPADLRCWTASYPAGGRHQRTDYHPPRPPPALPLSFPRPPYDPLSLPRAAARTASLSALDYCHSRQQQPPRQAFRYHTGGRDCVVRWSRVDQKVGLSGSRPDLREGWGRRRVSGRAERTALWAARV